jgi:hypothetical protein
MSIAMKLADLAVSGIDKIFALHEPKPTNQLKINMIPL